MLMRRGLRTTIDVGALAFAYLLAFAARFGFEPPLWAVRQALITLPYVVALTFVLMAFLEVHRHSWRYTSLAEVIDVVRATVATALILAAVRTLAPALDTIPGVRHLAIPYGVVIGNLAFSTILLVGARAVRRLQVQSRETRTLTRPDRAERVILVGAGRAGVMVTKELEARPDVGLVPVAFVDDDPEKQNQLINNVRVMGKLDDLGRLAEAFHVRTVIITIASADGATVRRVTELCDEYELEPRIIPGVYEIVGGRVNLSRIRPVEIEDLLGRDPVELDVTGIREFVTHDVVMVTGAGGSIGSELCRQLARFDPKTLVLVEQAENALWEVHRRLEEDFPSTEVVPAIADVCDRERIDQLMLFHRPRTVFHAAAHKHVPMMEWNPCEAVKNNVLGTKTVADLAHERGVERFVMISTDKAVNPTSVMGATKRLAERYVQHLAATSGKPFVSVRFGNVLGSNGSVVPVFKEQIARGGPVTVTHEEMVRYFMTIPEAAQLVIQAGALGSGGEIFVLDMGEPVRIVDLAHDLIRLSGFEPGVDIDIEYTGVRPGEKLYEEMHLSEENADRTVHPKIWVGRHTGAGISPEALTSVLDACSIPDPDTIRRALVAAVPEFTPSGLEPYEQDTAVFLATARPSEPTS